MLPLGAPGDAHNAAPGIHIPVGRAEAREGGHQIHAAGVLHLLGVVLRIPAFGEESHLVPQPLDDRAAHEHAALQRILHRLALHGGGDGGEQAVFALVAGLAGIH